MTSDTVGWIAVVIQVIAAIYIAHMREMGWWLMLAGNVLWAQVGYMTHLPSLIAVSVVMGISDLYGVYSWKRKNRTRYDDLMAPPPNGHKRWKPYKPRRTPRPLPPRLWDPED